MKKNCIFDKNKLCNDCGECYICELDSKKVCNNCGKCLELEGYDMKAIKIDEIAEDEKESIEIENELEKEFNDEETSIRRNLEDSDPDWEYIDDIVDLQDLINDESKDKDLLEEFPGLYIKKEEHQKHSLEGKTLKKPKKIIGIRKDNI